MSDSLVSERPKAVLVGVQVQDVTEAEHQASLAELARLVQTLGFDVVATVSQKRAAPAIATVVGEGKLKELARYTGGTGKVESKAPPVKRKKLTPEELEAEVEVYHGEDADQNEDGEEADAKTKIRATKVVFDSELTPNQLRNLESATGAEVLDRTGVIVEIFHRHARTREARLQVEIARLKYLAPRLREARGGADRQGGGIGAKGVGETAHELDRRRIRDRIAELSRELVDIQTSQEERRQRRTEQHTIALVGYTNAGKSSLMRVLTGSDVLVEDKLFATLDTTIRALYPETQPRLLVSDTVGFIKKLPHDLVASFRSTLDEARDASLLIYVVDSSDPTFRSQLQVTRDVLHEIGADRAPSLLILNKIDCVGESDRRALKLEFPDARQMSAQRPDDVRELHAWIVAFFERDMLEVDLDVPYAQGAVIGDIRKTLRVIKETHQDTGTVLRVRGYPDAVKRIQRRLTGD